jgi:hypothetical protein
MFNVQSKDKKERAPKLYRNANDPHLSEDWILILTSTRRDWIELSSNGKSRNMSIIGGTLP